MRRWLSCTLVRMCASHLSPHRIVDRQRLTVRAGVCSRRRACVLRRRRRRFRRTRTWRSRSPRCTSAEPPRLASACQSPPPLFGCAAYGDKAHLLACGAYGGCKDACAPVTKGVSGSPGFTRASPLCTARATQSHCTRSLGDSGAQLRGVLAGGVHTASSGGGASGGVAAHRGRGAC